MLAYWVLGTLIAANCGSHVIGCDIDPEALQQCHENCQNAQIEEFDQFLVDVTRLKDAWRSGFKVDTIVMNPPFGTKTQKNVDMVFLKQAIDVCKGGL